MASFQVSSRQRRPFYQGPLLILVSLLMGGMLTAGLLFGAGKRARASGESAGQRGGWTVVFSDTFESGISGEWQVTDTDGSTNGEYYWAATNVTASQGMTSVWATGGGAEGSLLVPLSDSYPNHASSLMVYGPVDLSGTGAVSLTYDYWLESEPLSDTFGTLISTNGVSFTTEAAFSGPSPGWQSLALNLDSYAGEPALWLAFSFSSNPMTTARGVFLDNVALQTQPSPPPIDAAVYLPAVLRLAETVSLPAWLDYFNLFRTAASLPLLNENPDWSNGGWLHSRYMVKNDYVGHGEDPNNPWYTPEGLAAAQNGNVFVTTWRDAPDETSLDFWLAAPFHAVSMMDPRLATTAFGSYREGDGGWQMAATLDVARGRTNTPAPGTYPVPYPGNGSSTWITRYYGGEFPDPLAPCPGFSPPTGPGIILQLGTGGTTPNVTSATLLANGSPVQICHYNETNYVHPNPGTQSNGRLILNGRDAIVIMPRNPLVAGTVYTASITANGQTTTWTFSATAAPRQEVWPEGMEFELR